MTLYQSFVLVMVLAVIGACTIIFLALCGVVVLLDKIVKNIRRGIIRRKRLRKEGCNYGSIGKQDLHNREDTGRTNE